MFKCGIIEAQKPLDKMRETGCRPETTLEIIEFWRTNPGRWSPAKLRRRLINLRPHQGADDFRLWQPPDNEKTPAAGNALHQMSVVGVRELIEWALAQSVTDEQRKFWSNLLAHDDLKRGQLSGFLANHREPLEAALKARSKLEFERASR